MSCYRLFVFDLDGTLLAADGSLPPETEAFVKELSCRARVTLATGRSLASARPYALRLEINAPAVLYHGAVIWDFAGGKALSERRIPPELARRALEVTARFPLHVQLYRAAEDPTVYVERVTAPVREFARKESLPVRTAALDRLADEAPLKFLLIGEPSVLPSAGKALREAVPTLTVVRAEREYLEVLPPDVDKGTALEWLCGRLGIPLSQVVAVGDQESDLSMIERAGLGVAMAHAPEGVKAKADKVVEAVWKLPI